MHKNLLLKYDAPPLTHDYSHSSSAILWKGMLEKPCSMQVTSKLKDGLMLLSLFTSNFIFLLAQTCWFFLSFWGKGTAMANVRDTPQSQVAVCYSRNQSRVPAQHGEVTLKISMCWFDSNYSTSGSCSPFKSFTFFDLTDLLSTSLS